MSHNTKQNKTKQKYPREKEIRAQKNTKISFWFGKKIINEDFKK